MEISHGTSVVTAFSGNTTGAFDAAAFSVPGGPAPWERPGRPLVLGSAALLVALSWLLLHSYAINAAGAIVGLFSFAVLFSLAVFAPLFAVVCLLAVTLYQNLLISILSPGIAHKTTHTMLLGTNFLFTMMLCSLALVLLSRNWGALNPAARRTLAAYLAFLGLCLAYLAYGASASDLTSALIYFRYFISGASLLIVGYFIGRQVRFNALATAFLIIGLPAIIFGYVEWAFPESVYNAINVVAYMQLKYQDAPTRAYAAILNLTEWRKWELFNLTGIRELGLNIYSTRLCGTILHPISFGYSLCALAIVSFSVGNLFVLALCLPLLIISGTKGPLIVLFGSLFIYAVAPLARRPGVRTAGMLVLLGFYVVSGVAHGSAQKDYHVIGFWSGLNSLFTNPLGHGLGVGGNLSAEGWRKDTESWQKSQRAGVTEYALESAIGTMFYQLGGWSLLLLLLFLGVMIRLVTLFATGLASPQQLLLPIALGLVVANGVFQEEAFSPYALGFIALFCGVVYSNCDVLAAAQAHTTVPIETEAQQNTGSGLVHGK